MPPEPAPKRRASNHGTRRLEFVVEHGRCAYWEQDERARFTLFLYGGGHAAKTWGERFLGRTLAQVGRPLSGTWSGLSALQRARRAFRDVVIVHAVADGETRYLSLTGEPVLDSAGRFTGYRGVAEDVTERLTDERLHRLERTVVGVLAAAGAATSGVTAALNAICTSEGWDAARYWHRDHATDRLRTCASWSRDAASASGTWTRSDPEDLLGSQVGDLSLPVWVPDQDEGPASARARATADRAFLCPIQSRGRVIGVLDFSGRDMLDPTEAQRAALEALGLQISSFCERTTLLDAMRDDERRATSTIELAAIGISHVTEDGRFIHVNRQLCDMLGYTRDELLGLTVRDVSHPDDLSVTDRNIARLGAGEIDFFKAEKRYLRKDGTTIWVRITVAPRRGADGRTLHHISIVENVSDRRQAEERVRFLATHDEMTGLPNRTMFGQLLTHAIEQARRYRRSFAVLFLDLDRFKIINDSLGHEAGDELLKVMAGRLRESVRSSDVVARLGGDEFMLLIEELSHRHAAATVARNVLSVVLRPLEIMGHECRVTASIGIALFPEHAQDPTTLMRSADMAMYLAKEEGKNNYQFYTPNISSLSVERLTIEMHLRRALERHELSLHYQAKVDMRTGAINGVEALLRWSNAELGSVSPTRFIPIAEDSGLIVPIGRWAIRTACEQSAAWLREGLPPIRLAVNLSPRQFRDPNLLNDVIEVIQESGLPPSLLEIEITESMIMHDVEQAVQKLTRLKAMGVRLAIDDFGTGYSSLAQLKRFPIDTLKVDRSFIKEIPGDTEDRAITEAIISMGRTLGVTVVAEGVETAEQQAFLSGHHCDEMQGFYFSRPTPPEAFADLLRTHVPEPRT